MPRSPTHLGAGNVNLRGKKSKMMACGCCDVIDFRDEYETTRSAREELSLGLDDIEIGNVAEMD